VSGNLGSGHLGSGQLGSGNLGSERHLGSGQLWSRHLGSEDLKNNSKIDFLDNKNNLYNRECVFMEFQMVKFNSPLIFPSSTY